MAVQIEQEGAEDEIQDFRRVQIVQQNHERIVTPIPMASRTSVRRLLPSAQSMAYYSRPSMALRETMHEQLDQLEMQVSSTQTRRKEDAQINDISVGTPTALGPISHVSGMQAKNTTDGSPVSLGKIKGAQQSNIMSLLNDSLEENARVPALNHITQQPVRLDWPYPPDGFHYGLDDSHAIISSTTMGNPNVLDQSLDRNYDDNKAHPKSPDQMQQDRNLPSNMGVNFQAVAWNPPRPEPDRTQVNIYSDEFQWPDVILEATSSPGPMGASTSTSDGLFAQRLQAANSRLLEPKQLYLPIPIGPSPFRAGSPLAETLQDFSTMDADTLNTNTWRSTEEQTSESLRQRQPQQISGQTFAESNSTSAWNTSRGSQNHQKHSLFDHLPSLKGIRGSASRNLAPPPLPPPRFVPVDDGPRSTIDRISFGPQLEQFESHIEEFGEHVEGMNERPGNLSPAWRLPVDSFVAPASSDFEPEWGLYPVTPLSMHSP